MRILVVNPAEYGYMDWIYRNWNPSAMRYASWQKAQGHEVQVYCIRPELMECRCSDCCHLSRCESDKARAREALGKPPSQWSCLDMMRVKDRIYYYKGSALTQHIGNRSCGHWEAEHISRPLFRIGRPLSEFKAKLLDYRPDQVHISCMFTYYWEGVKEAIDATRAVLPGAKIVLGGIYPTLAPEHAMLLGAEEVEVKLQGSLNDFTKLDLSLFEEVPCMVDMLTSLGCPNRCGYCAVHLLEGQEQVRKNPIEVVNEIEYYSAHGVKFIRFLDSNLLCNYDNHFRIILEEIIKRNIKVSLSSYGGVEARFLTQENLDLMKAAGFVALNVPIETTSERLLKRWHRNLYPENWKKFLSTKKSDLDIRSYIMAGCLDQTLEEVLDAIKMVEELGLKPVVLPFTPIPRTSEYKLALPFLRENWKLEDLHPLLFPLASDQLTVKDLKSICDKYSHSQIFSNLEQHPQGAEYQTCGLSGALQTGILV